MFHSWVRNEMNEWLPLYARYIVGAYYAVGLHDLPIIVPTLALH